MGELQVLLLFSICEPYLRVEQRLGEDTVTCLVPRSDTTSVSEQEEEDDNIVSSIVTCLRRQSKILSHAVAMGDETSFQPTQSHLRYFELGQ